jgi:quercetin dioxygenase-like cupin family protein
MKGAFVPASEIAREKLDWGTMGWCCRPSDSQMKNLVVIEVTLQPGGGHAFHKHDRQEEVIYCIEGEVEQWIGEERRVLRRGDSVVLPAGQVHASFNKSAADAKLLAIISPAIDDKNGYEVAEVADQAPWKGLK